MSSVYAVSVDSRSRNVDEPDNKYTVQLFRTLDRVKSVQLGSFQFTDERFAYTRDSTFTFNEPVPTPPDAYIRFTETTSTLNTRTNAMTETSRVVSILMPPMLNQITGMDNGTQEVTTALNHGLVFGVNFYPLIGKRLQLIGGDFPQDLHAFTTPAFPTDSPWPVVTTATVDAPYSTTDSKSFTWAAGYMSEITGGVGSAELRMLDTTGTPDNYFSYIYAPPPTLVELTTMMNAAVTYLNNRVDLDGTVVTASAATPIVVTTTTTHGLTTGDQVVVSGVVGNDPANATFLLTVLSPTTFELDGSVGGGAGAGGTWFSPQRLNMSATFGMDNSLNEIVGTAPDRVTRTGDLVITRSLRLNRQQLLLGPGDVRMDPPTLFDIPSRFLRSINITPGNYSAPEIAAELTTLMNPYYFLIGEAERTFHYTLPGGSPASLVIMYGRYTGPQLAEWMTSQLSVVPSQLSVTFDAVSSKFTITHNLDLAFSINLSTTPLLATNLGFDPLDFAAATSFTSVRSTGHGTETATLPPANTYLVTADEAAKKFTFSTQAPTRFYTEGGTSTLQVGAEWVTQVGAGLDFAHNFQAGTVLTAVRPTLSSTQAGTKAITDASNATPIVITTGAAHGLTTGDNLTVELVGGNTAANGTWFVTVTAATTFELIGSVGSGVYAAGTGTWWTNVSLVTAVQRPSAVFTVVVQSAWDASTGTPLLTLEPTASIFSAQDAGTASRDPLGTPAVTDGMILLHDARNNQFTLHMKHPGGTPELFGFPPVVWPPQTTTIVSGGTGVADLQAQPQYDPTTLGIPVSTTYTSPFTYNLLPPDYILVRIAVNCASQDLHSHSFRGESYPIFAKLLITSPYQNVSEQMHFTTFAGHARFNNMIIEFLNPDGTPVRFNGRPHTYTLLFTLHEDKAVLPCL